jgi:hypothetical protein
MIVPYTSRYAQILNHPGVLSGLREGRRNRSGLVDGEREDGSTALGQEQKVQAFT